MTKQWFDALLTAMIENGGDAPDFLFVPGKQPLAQSHTALHEFEIDGRSALTDRDIQAMAELLINGDKRLLDDFENRGSCDCSYSLADRARFRVNIYRQRGMPSIVLRKLAASIPSMDALGLPPIFREMIREKNGIILVTGGTGSGKTTTLAAMLNELNQTHQLHVVTLEDPIEFMHTNRGCVFSQRELGKDFRTFADGLRAALRQAPKVIFVGEIRDRETMEIAMSASETGHVVYATVHTIDAGQTVSRIVGMFDREEEQQIRQRLAQTIRYVVSQRIVSTVSGGRLLVTEIMGSSLRTREVLLYGESDNRTFYEIIEAGAQQGWHTFDQDLLDAYKRDAIDENVAMLFCTNKNKVRRDIDLLKKVKQPAGAAQDSGLKLQAHIAVPTDNGRSSNGTPRPAARA